MDVPEIHINNEEEENSYLITKRFEIHKKIFDDIEAAYPTTKTKLIIFRIVNNFRGYVLEMRVERKDWLDSLNKCLEYFEEIEEYEICNKVDQLIDKIENGDI